MDIMEDTLDDYPDPYNSSLPTWYNSFKETASQCTGGYTFRVPGEN